LLLFLCYNKYGDKMSLRFIYGRSGTGKTTYCFNEIKKLINNNKKVYIITPEQFSFTAENNLIRICEKKSVVNAEVITFERMAHRIINEIGGITNTGITNAGKSMLLINIVEKQKDNLNFLGKTDKNLDISLRIITELKKNNVTSQALEDNINNIEDNYLKLKLNDIKVLYSEFNKEISNKYVDEDDLLTIVKDKIKESEMFKNSYIFIDEFAGFTKQEYNIIGELFRLADEVNITIATDSLEESKFAENDVFNANKKTIAKITKIANLNNINILEPVKLVNNYRYKSEELKYLEENLYSLNTKKYEKECQDIKLFLANNNYSEIENVANNIIELVRDNGYRYKDISIITKQTEDYASLIKSIFKKYNIPVFIDEKKQLNQNILVKYIISVLDIFSKGWNTETIFNYLKTGFSNIEHRDIFILENYCKKCGITGFKKFSQQWTVITDSKENIEYLNDIRIQVINPLIKFKEKLGKNKTVKDITKSLYFFLEENNIKDILLNKINEFDEKGLVDLANIYNTSWDLLIDILDELVAVLGEEKISFENYTNLLKAGFNNSSLGKIPATLDEVIVGDVDRTRSGKKKVIFIIGLNDGKFPSVSKNEGFINDEERLVLKENGIELAKTTKEQIYDENFNIYKAFTVAEEKLYLSYPASDNEGKGLRKSILINKIRKIFPNLEEESDIVQTKTYISSKETTFDLLLLNLRKYLNGEEIDLVWFDVYKIFSEDKEYKEKLERALQGFNYSNIGENITKENLEKLYGDTLQTSISKLESYKRCPFSYYLKYGLKLSDRTELKLEKMDTGTLMHDIIDDFFELLKEKNVSIQEIEDERIDKIIGEILNNKLQLKQNYIFNSIPKYVVLTKRLKKVVIRAVKYIINTLKNSNFKVLGTEIEFGENKQYEPIQIALENGKKVEIIGKIDRIDIAENKDGRYIRIIDYKSSVKSIDLNEVVAGIQIQLLTYLDAVSKKENADLAGVLYFNLIEPIIKAKNKHLTEEELEQEIRNNFKMNGLILGDVDVVRMMDNNLTAGNSNIIPAYIDKDGNVSKNKPSILEKEDFLALQNKVEKVIKQISEEIMSGEIAQKPVYFHKNKRTACEFCKYKAICGFDSKMCGNSYNYIPNLSKNEILSKLKSE